MNYLQIIEQLLLVMQRLIVSFSTKENGLLIASSFAQALKVYSIFILKLAVITQSFSPFALYKVETVMQAKSNESIIEIQHQRSESTVTTIERKVGKYTLQERYEVLAEPYFYANVIPYLPIVDKVLTEKGLDDNVYFVQVMFFIGQHESHWNTQSISGYSVGSEHPTGLFQFLPSTFRSVSAGNIFDAEDQIRAYVAMVERGRVDEYATLFIGGLNPAAKAYVLRYR